MYPFKDEPAPIDGPPPITFGDCSDPPYKKPVKLNLFGLKNYIAFCDGEDTERLEVYRRIFAAHPTVEYYEPNDLFNFFACAESAFVNGDYSPSIPFFDGFLVTDGYKYCFALAYMQQLLLEEEVFAATGIDIRQTGKMIRCQYPPLTESKESTLSAFFKSTGQTEAQKELLEATLSGAGLSADARRHVGLAVSLSSSSFSPFEEEKAAALGQKEMNIIVETANALWEAYL